MSLERTSFDDKKPNATLSPMQNFDLSLVFERLKQIRTYISQANQMMISMSSENNSKSERFRKIRQLVNELQEQENSYVQLMNRYLNLDSNSKTFINGTPSKPDDINEDNVDGDDGDDEEENDDTSIDLEDNHSDNSGDSPRVITPRRPLIEDHLGNYPPNLQPPSTPAQEEMWRGTVVTDSCNLDSDDSSLQAALSAQLALLKEKNSELLAATASLNNINTTTSDSYLTDLRNERNSLHLSLQEQHQHFIKDKDDASHQSSAKRFARQWSGSRISPSRDFTRNPTSERPVIRTQNGGASLEGVESNDEAEECSSRTSEVTDNVLMATAIPKELLALRRQLDELQYNQEKISSEAATAAVRPNGDGAGGTALRSSERDLINRLASLHKNRNEVHHLLKEIDDLKNEMDEEGTSSVGSSQIQIANTLSQMASASKTEEEAKRVVGNIEAQNKLTKLHEIRNRLNALKEMMIFHQSAASDLQQPECVSSDQAKDKDAAGVKELQNLLTTLRSGTPLTSLTPGQLDLLSSVMADESCTESYSENQPSDIESSRENLNGFVSQSRVVDSDYYRGRGPTVSTDRDREITLLKLERDRLAEMCGVMDEKLHQLSSRYGQINNHKNEYDERSPPSNRWMATYSNGFENEQFVNIHAENLEPHGDYALYEEDDADSGGDMQQVEEEEEEVDPRAGSPLFSYTNRYSPRANACSSTNANHHSLKFTGSPSKSNSSERRAFNNSSQFPVGLEARARGLYSEPVTSSPSQSKRVPSASPSLYPPISAVAPPYPTEMWSPQYLQEQSLRLMSEMCQLQYNIQSVVSQMYSNSPHLSPVTSTLSPEYSAWNSPQWQQQAFPPQENAYNSGVPPLDLKSYKNQLSSTKHRPVVGRYFGEGNKQESAAKLASKKLKPSQPNQYKYKESPIYRPGVSADICGTAFELESESEMGSVASDSGEQIFSIPSKTSAYNRNRSGPFKHSLSANRGESNNNHPKDGYDSASLHMLVERGISLLADDDGEADRQGKFSAGKMSTSGTIGSISNSVSSPYNLKRVPGRKEDTSRNACSSFDALRETIYSEVATLISQNESCPHFLIELFRELQHLSSDYLRQRVLYLIHDLVTKSLTKQVLNMSAQNPSASSQSDQEEYSQNEDEIDQKGAFSHEKEFIKTATANASKFPRHLSRYEKFKNPSVKEDRNRLEESNLRDCQGYLDADYAEVAPSTSSVSTPTLSPKRSTNNENFSTNLDKVLQAFQDKAKRKQRQVPKCNDERFDVMSDSSLSESMTPVVNTQELEQQIKHILHYLIPLLKEHQGNVITSQLIIWTRDATINRVTKIINSSSLSLMNHEALSSAACRYDQSSDGISLEDIALEGGRPDAEFMRFFYKQLSVQLYEALVKYEGKKLSTCIEDLMVDISEILFNELAFFRLIVDLDAGKSGLTTDTEGSEVEQNAIDERNFDDEEEEDDNDRDVVEMTSKKVLSLHNNTGNEADEDDSNNEEEEEESISEFDDLDRIPASSEIKLQHGGGATKTSFGAGQFYDNIHCSSSLSFSLAPSETKPMTQIGSDEDEDEEYMVENSDGDNADTAVAHSSLLQHMVDMAAAQEPPQETKSSNDEPEIFIDAEEKDAILGSCGEKGEQKQSSEPTADTTNDQDEQPITPENFPTDRLALNDLEEELTNGEHSQSGQLSYNPNLEAIVDSLPNCSQLAGNENELPPPDDNNFE